MKYTAYIRYFREGFVSTVRHEPVEAKTEAEAKEKVYAAYAKTQMKILRVRLLPYDEKTPEFHKDDVNCYLFDQEWKTENAPADIADNTWRCARALEDISDQMRRRKSDGISLATMTVLTLSTLLQLGLLILLLVRM